jgi:hypothetical protein
VALPRATSLDGFRSTGKGARGRILFTGGLGMAVRQDSREGAVHEGLADWEVGYLLVELRTGRFTGTP